MYRIIWDCLDCRKKLTLKSELNINYHLIETKWDLISVLIVRGLGPLKIKKFLKRFALKAGSGYPIRGVSCWGNFSLDRKNFTPIIAEIKKAVILVFNENYKIFRGELIGYRIKNHQGRGKISKIAIIKLKSTNTCVKIKLKGIFLDNFLELNIKLGDMIEIAPRLFKITKIKSQKYTELREGKTPYENLNWKNNTIAQVKNKKKFLTFKFFTEIVEKIDSEINLDDYLKKKINSGRVEIRKGIFYFELGDIKHQETISTLFRISKYLLSPKIIIFEKNYIEHISKKMGGFFSPLFSEMIFLNLYKQDQLFYSKYKYIINKIRMKGLILTGRALMNIKLAYRDRGMDYFEKITTLFGLLKIGKIKNTVSIKILRFFSYLFQCENIFKKLQWTYNVNLETLKKIQ